MPDTVDNRAAAEGPPDVMIEEAPTGARGPVAGPRASRTTLAADGVRLAWRSHGGGPGAPLLLIAGTGYAGATWTPDLLATLSRDRPVIEFDHRGTGASGSGEGPYDTRLFAADTAAVIRAAAGGPVHVLGHSMGGRVAQWLAIDHPELVASLILAASGSGRGPNGSRGPSGVPYHTALGLARDGYRDHLRAQITNTFFTAEFAAAEPAAVDWLVAAFWRSRPNLADYLKHVVARQGHDTSAELARIAAPTLVLVGDRDTHAGGTGSHWEQSAALAAGIPNATLAPVAGLAHGLFWQWPERATAILGSWLAGRS